MRPLRFLLTLLSFVFAFFCLLFFGIWRDGSEAEAQLQQRSRIRALFTWRTPSSLFPPSAIISLTDDNSTFFLARPAAFGPLLPTKSLSGQLWVGSGFGDDHLGRGGPGAGAEGELGCSDIPEWQDGESHPGWRRLADLKTAVVGLEEGKSGRAKRSVLVQDDVEEEEDAEDDDTADDGTDDHLHHPLSPSDGLKSNGRPAGHTKKPAHADIQSLQETAEIAGNVVLLSRGGCGFLEKVKWAQRRGATALIIGDDVQGGPLVTMYARGDTSNVTIPALFTSHMTAHLLSSLIPPGGFMDDLSAEEMARLGIALGDKVVDGTGHRTLAAVEKPNFTTTRGAARATASTKVPQRVVHPEESQDDDGTDEDETSRGWLSSWFGGRRNAGGESRRPPTSGNLGWVMQTDLDHDLDERERNVKQVTRSPAAKATSYKRPAHDLGDSFKIGVQDWRDPDMVAEEKERQIATASGPTTTSSTIVQSSQVAKQTGFDGGSITPGSGEYAKTHHEIVQKLGQDGEHAAKESQDATSGKSSRTGKESANWLARLFESTGKASDEESDKAAARSASSNRQTSKADAEQRHHSPTYAPQQHEGLWVTLTPTPMSSSPFFDTLLVLVVSPLVTLTVVYALLLLRSRIRRRRWRAPKSVVERLPVRTYQTMTSTAGSTTSSTTSSSPSATATTPLLPPSTATRPINTRARPRSRTASEVPVHPTSSSLTDELAPPSLEQIEEKRAAGLAEWRRRYGGKQRECVVCLEEYVDGVSRVMSLPCGHEFHVGCM
ncbi:hypothetical protein LTR62_006927 [Meristemomyces frigidus]|uniref:RING-type domain-containing protein n=1 Tax=Meristemomyces frigidus TaxID=1508187 RepID=A0AAN7TC52_9PEZI|nr:hypothetical protein LTR62_006927 [Meristemomyces frigidus]